MLTNEHNRIKLKCNEYIKYWIFFWKAQVTGYFSFLIRSFQNNG